jgi:pimeloyl-ACP methyl ester carboxylesterase
MPDESQIYKSPDGYHKMMAHYDTRLAAWPIPYETQSVETRHGRTHVIVCGREDAPPLMIFHGWAANASAAYLEYDLKRLGESFRIYLPDTIGQTGRSAPQRPSTAGPGYGEWALDLINGLKLDTLCIMGISGGGYLSLKAASALQERVNAVLAICSAGLSDLIITSWRFLSSGFPLTLFPNEATALRFVKAMLAPDQKTTALHAEMAREMRIIFETHRFQAGPKPLTDEELKRITAPVYVLLGEDDVFVNVSKSILRAQGLISHVEIELIPRCGHMMTIDRPGLAEERLMSYTAHILDKSH